MTHSATKFTVVASVPLIAVALVAILFTVQANAVSTTVSSSISSIISVFTSSGTVALNTTPTAGGVQTINNDVITVSTNDGAGYTLKLAETAASGALTSGGNSIPATSGTFASPIAESVNTWGYRVDNAGTFGAGPTSAVSSVAIGAAKFAAVPATAAPDTIKTTAATATNDTTNVWYGVAVNTNTPSGAYSNSVTYTAVAN